MNLTVQPGDTLAAIAANYTLSADYAAGLANFNNLDATTINAAAVDPADALTPDGTMMLAVGQTLTIPDNWLRTGALVPTAQPSVTSPGPGAGLTLAKVTPMLLIAGAILTAWYIAGDSHGDSEPDFDDDAESESD